MSELFNTCEETDDEGKTFDIGTCKSSSSKVKMSDSSPSKPKSSSSNRPSKCDSGVGLRKDSKDSSDGEKLNILLDTVLEIKSSQDGLRRMFESKLDKLRSDLMQNIDTKVRALRDEFSMDLSKEAKRLDQVVSSVQSMVTRMDSLERKVSASVTSSGSSNGTGPGGGLSDTDVCITASGIPVRDGEDLLEVADSLLQALGPEVHQNVLVTGATRLKTRFNNRPGLVKISFQNVDEKICVLRNKMKLKGIKQYERVYIKSFKSHVERLIELNARTLLRELPQGKSLRVSANGRILQRAQQQEESEMD